MLELSLIAFHLGISAAVDLKAFPIILLRKVMLPSFQKKDIPPASNVESPHNKNLNFGSEVVRDDTKTDLKI